MIWIGLCFAMACVSMGHVQSRVPAVVCAGPIMHSCCRVCVRSGKKTKKRVRRRRSQKPRRTRTKSPRGKRRKRRRGRSRRKRKSRKRRRRKRSRSPGARAKTRRRNPKAQTAGMTTTLRSRSGLQSPKRPTSQGGSSTFCVR